MLVRTVTSIATLLLYAEIASASSCPVSLGEIVQLTTVEEAYDNLPKTSPKDEFETTAEYENRISAIPYPSGFIAIERKDEFEVQYNADKSRFEFRDGELFGDGFYYREPYDYIGNGVVLTESDRSFFLAIDKQVIGTQIGSNAFGVEAEITKENWTRFYVYEGPRSGSSFRNMETDFNRQEQVKNNPYINEINAHYFVVPSDRGEARVLKDTMRRALVVNTKRPFQFEGHDTSSPTIDDPRDIKITDRFLVADVHCAIVTDGSGRVLKIVQTND